MLRKMPEYIQQQEAFEANQSRSLEAQRIKREQDLRNEQNAIVSHHDCPNPFAQVTMIIG